MDILLVEDDMTLFKELSEELEQWDFKFMVLMTLMM